MNEIVQDTLANLNTVRIWFFGIISDFFVYIQNYCPFVFIPIFLGIFYFIVDFVVLVFCGDHILTVFRFYKKSFEFKSTNFKGFRGFKFKALRFFRFIPLYRRQQQLIDNAKFFGEKTGFTRVDYEDMIKHLRLRKLQNYTISEAKFHAKRMRLKPEPYHGQKIEVPEVLQKHYSILNKSVNNAEKA